MDPLILPLERKYHNHHCETIRLIHVCLGVLAKHEVHDLLLNAPTFHLDSAITSSKFCIQSILLVEGEGLGKLHVLWLDQLRLVPDLPIISVRTFESSNTGDFPCRR